MNFPPNDLSRFDANIKTLGNNRVLYYREVDYHSKEQIQYCTQKTLSLMEEFQIDLFLLDLSEAHTPGQDAQEMIVEHTRPIFKKTKHVAIVCNDSGLMKSTIALLTRALGIKNHTVHESVDLAVENLLKQK